MKHHFYSHIVEIESIITELDVLELNAEEKNELITIVDSTIHHVVMDTVLSELSPPDQKTLLSYLVENKHAEVWKLLTEKMKSPHETIKKATEKVKKEMKEDIHETHKNRKK